MIRFPFGSMRSTSRRSGTRGMRDMKWWSIRVDYRTAILEAYVAESPVLSP
jgi:hypothetical protein